MSPVAKSNRVIITACLCGAGTRKEQAPTVPYTPEEIARQVVDVARAGAAVAHIHVRKDTTLPDGTLVEGYKSMDLEQFTRTVELSRRYLAEAGLDILLNLTTSGGEYEDYKRLQHLGALKPDLCSFDPGTLNWADSYIFENSPRFLNQLADEVVRQNVKPEFEVFDTGFLGSANHYIKTHAIPGPPYYQFIMGVGGAMPGTVENLAFMVNKLPDGALWSVSGIGRAHMPMMLAGLALGCDGLRVGLEDNVLFDRDAGGGKVIATNVMLVERAAALIRLAGREPAGAAEARTILGLKNN